MILVCGGLADTVTELVCSRLEACGYAYRLLDQSRFPAGFTVHWEWIGGRARGTINGPGWSLDLDELTGVYARYLPQDTRMPIAGVSEEMWQGIYAEAEAGLVALFDGLPCTVVNRTHGGMSNHSKPFQALVIEECGLKSPETLVTNDPAEAISFFEENKGDVIYKSLSGIRSIVRRISREQQDRFQLLQHGPAQFQRFVPGDNVRVHVVGDRVFPTRVRSEAVDYRYARLEGQECNMSAEVLAPEVEEACIRLARRLDLLFAGIDLKITPDGEVFCFEVNPSPGFTFYELGTGQPISAALADLLHAAPSDLDAANSQRQHAAALSVPGL
jgi:hypothetical protein